MKTSDQSASQNDCWRQSRTANEFLLARLGKGCWVVGYQGKLIAGAVLSSVAAAAAYAADLAHAFGQPQLSSHRGGGRSQRRLARLG